MKARETDNRPRSGPKKTSVTGLTPLPLTATAQRDLGDLAQKLASSPPVERRRVTRWLADHWPYPVLTAVIDAVLAALLRSQNPDHRAALADALAGIGPVAANRVLLALLKAKRPWQRVVLASVLECVGPLLDRGERVEMAAALMTLADRPQGPEVAAALGRAATVVRTAIQLQLMSEERS